MRTRRAGILATIALLASTAGTAAASSAVAATDVAGAAASSPVFRLDQKPYGRSYAEWASVYGCWELEIPRPQHPAIVPTRARNCEVVGKVAMLGASGTGPEGCKVPQGKALIEDPFGFECSTAEGDGPTWAGLRRCAVKGLNGIFGRGKLVTRVQNSIDGHPVARAGSYKVVTTPTVAHLPEKNIIEYWMGGKKDIPAQRTKQMSDVVIYIIKPLSLGWHTIRFTLHLKGGKTESFTWRVKVVKS